MAITKEAFFKPDKPTTQNKASVTHSAAKQIIAVETAQRAEKTQRLRLLREAQEAALPPLSTPLRKKRPVDGSRPLLENNILSLSFANPFSISGCADPESIRLLAGSIFDRPPSGVVGFAD
ncbi:hypothetical protein [Agrobacterium tumefaciens]|uniref:hypothetical protein n=1 Tax=Agrobacterium tumefaciens TaxID=358 RepID=UPI00287EEAD6|nr:hypothetical protein [Agrobacterium tumefaciens]MDS7597772.1 hypothetical protein [Agrobacterium tumefaciens]